MTCLKCRRGSTCAVEAGGLHVRCAPESDAQTAQGGKSVFCEHKQGGGCLPRSWLRKARRGEAEQPLP
jgi:hypothetical protein